jgi:hypothetical protein
VLSHAYFNVKGRGQLGVCVISNIFIDLSNYKIHACMGPMH